MVYLLKIQLMFKYMGWPVEEEFRPKGELYTIYEKGRHLSTEDRYSVWRFLDVKTEKDEARLAKSDAVSTGFPTVSTRVWEVLKDLIQDDVQVFDTELRSARGTVINGFKLLNIIKLVQGADLEKCHFSGATPGHINGLVPKDEDFMNGANLAREAASPHIIYASQAVKDRLQKAKIKQIECLTPDLAWRRIWTLPYPGSVGK